MLLFKIPFFAKAALKYAESLKPQSSLPKVAAQHEGLKEIFTDSNGVKYYHYPNEIDMPVKRFNALQAAMIELQSVLTADQIEMFLSAMEEAINDTINPPAKGKPSTGGIAKVSWLIKEMQLRRKELLSLPTLLSVACVLYIRQDENPADVNDLIAAEKLEQFKKEAAGNLGAFFLESPLRVYIPFSGITESDLSRLLAQTEIRTKALMEMIQDSSSESAS